ncbi:unnamed protein product [Lasius platythorax]|uniref:Uncharacterized protein n=1 Tax=Lasius platythorax TaxID=488582 RepID=A0AAV2N171_9HYME
MNLHLGVPHDEFIQKMLADANDINDINATDVAVNTLSITEALLVHVHKNEEQATRPRIHRSEQRRHQRDINAKCTTL